MQSESVISCKQQKEVRKTNTSTSASNNAQMSTANRRHKGNRSDKNGTAKCLLADAESIRGIVVIRTGPQSVCLPMQNQLGES